MSSSNTTDLSLPNTGRKKRNPKPINRLDPSSQTTSKKKNQCSTIATSSRSATSVADAAKPTNNNQKVCFKIEEGNQLIYFTATSYTYFFIL